VELDIAEPLQICFTKDKGGIHTETASGTQVVWGEKSDIIVMSLHGEHLSGSERDSRAVWYGRLKSARSSFLEVDVKSHARARGARFAAVALLIYIPQSRSGAEMQADTVRCSCR
jgi:hypothetical protein